MKYFGFPRLNPSQRRQSRIYKNNLRKNNLRSTSMSEIPLAIYVENDKMRNTGGCCRINFGWYYEYEKSRKEIPRVF